MMTFRKTWDKIMNLDKSKNKNSILCALKKWFDKDDAAYFYDNIISGNIDNLKISDKLYKINDFLYFYNCDTLDYEVGKSLVDKYFMGIGACSSERTGNFHGRNYDWYYGNDIEFLTRISNKVAKYKSISISSYVPQLKKGNITEEDIETYKMIPFLAVDGINENGVCCNINVVPRGDKGITTGTHPEASISLNQIMLPRYVLDNFSTAKDAVEDIRDNVNVYGSTGETVPYEIHMMVSDEISTYIVEFIHNECIVTKVYSDSADIAYPPVMTNFYINDVTPNSDGTVTINHDGNPNESGVTPYGAGLERHNEIINWIASVSGDPEESDVIDLMTNVIKYTNAYTIPFDDEDFWYTELVEGPISEGSEEKTTCSSPISDYEYTYNKFMERWESRSREAANTWQTVHSTIYDIPNRKLTLITQEDPDNKIVIYL